MKFLIDFKDNSSDADISAYLQSFSATVEKTFNKFTKTYLIESPVTPPTSSIVDIVINDDTETVSLLNTTVYLDQNFGSLVTNGTIPLINLDTSDENNWWKLYSFLRPELDVATYSLNRRGNGNIVYVLDSGCNVNHAEFNGSTVTNLWSFNNDFTDTNGHGTAISAVIAGQTCGMTDAAVKNVKIFHDGVSTKQSDLVSALDVIYNDFINTTIPGYFIVNASWAIPKNTFIESKIRAMIDVGIIFVAAAGNNGVPIENVTPASMLDVLTVGSYNKDLMPSNFSNYSGGSDISYTTGETNYGALDGWAPGEEIRIPTLNGAYGLAAGTSMSAAIQSAALAYNLSHSNFPKTYDRTIYGFAKEHSFLRSDMLDLSDPKYVDSVNKLTTFVDNLSQKVIKDTIPKDYRLTPGFLLNLMEFANPKLIERVEFLQSLPYGIELLPQGEFSGQVPSNLNQRYVQHIIPTRAIYRDGTIDEFDLTFHIMAADWNSEVDSTGDPDLDIKLQFTYYCFQHGDCIYNEHTCIANCGSAWCNQGSQYCPKGAFGCFCDGF
jgi:subtilisin family serine protease